MKALTTKALRRSTTLPPCRSTSSQLNWEGSVPPVAATCARRYGRSPTADRTLSAPFNPAVEGTPSWRLGRALWAVLSGQERGLPAYSPSSEPGPRVANIKWNSVVRTRPPRPVATVVDLRSPVHRPTTSASRRDDGTGRFLTAGPPPRSLVAALDNG